MSTFQCKVSQIKVHPHPNADRLELAQVGDYRCVIGKGLYQTGDLVVYIPEAALVPEWALRHYGYWNEEAGKGLLAGSNGDRVKAVRLRGEVSQGIVFPLRSVPEKAISNAIEYLGEDGKFHHYVASFGEDLQELLGITKYEPPIPTCMAGEVYNAGTSITVAYDIENIKAYPDVFEEGEEIIFTEKIHGTFFQIGLLPATEQYYHPEHLQYETEHGRGYFFIASKGLGANGLCFKFNERNENNLYIRAAQKYNLFAKMLKLRHEMLESKRSVWEDPIILHGEVYGAVQDLTYGAKQGEIFFRAFDICIGERIKRVYFSDYFFTKALTYLEVDRCPVIYRGPFSKEKIAELTHNTRSVVAPNQISEGGVIRPVEERKNDSIPSMSGRVILKSINEAYLLRKGNATEFN